MQIQDSDRFGRKCEIHSKAALAGKEMENRIFCCTGCNKILSECSCRMGFLLVQSIGIGLGDTGQGLCEEDRRDLS